MILLGYGLQLEFMGYVWYLVKMKSHDHYGREVLILLSWRIPKVLGEKNVRCLNRELVSSNHFKTILDLLID